MVVELLKAPVRTGSGGQLGHLRPQCDVGVACQDGRGLRSHLLLTLLEREHLMIYTAGKLAEERRDRGVQLNLPEATALITSFI